MTDNTTNKCVVILSGSVKDEHHVKKIRDELYKSKKVTHLHDAVISAHKNTPKVLEAIKTFEGVYKHLIWVTVAGKSNALSGVVAGNSSKPVIACPPFSDKVNMMVNLQSTLQCPCNIPVMTILEPVNVALAIDRIFNF